MSREVFYCWECGKEIAINLSDPADRVYLDDILFEKNWTVVNDGSNNDVYLCEDCSE